VCGIAGIVDPQGAASTALIAMADALAHRGPDGEGYAVVAGPGPVRLAGREALASGAAARMRAGLAHRRLTIIDLSDASAQPMSTDDGRFTLAYNGELYNYLELRRELERAGRTLYTSGDTEIVLQAWAHWGPACLGRFVGMWAFALLDAGRNELVLCRDRFGIKPLFYTQFAGVLRFASEIKGLLAVMSPPEPDHATVSRFLVAAADTDTQTFFRGIRRLPPAHRLTVPLDDPAAMRLERYWAVPDHDGVDDRDAPARFAERFRESVALHTRSDVAVGTCLSGGLDSSAIVCTASRLRDERVLPTTYRHRAFGYVPPDGSVSEKHWMDLVVDQTGIGLTEVRPDAARFDESLPTIVRQQDEPFGSTSIAAQWFVFEAARAAGMKVMLDGQGADEVLGGYHGYLSTVAAGLLHQRRRIAYARLAIDYRRRLGGWPLPAGSATSLLPRQLQTAAGRVHARRTVARPPVPTISDVLTAGAADALPASEPLPTEMQALLRHQVEASLPALLRYEDRNSMAHSIEARVPFLDHRLVELAFALPAAAKVRGAETKRLLRQAMKGVLPEAIRTRRDKLGFRADPAAAARFAARHRAELVANRTAEEQAWFEPAGVAALIDAAQRDGNLDFPLWRMINVKLWARAHWGDEASR
jgi:asparagine synthase (glutamine-hydrolysing)